jgi:hypothetical protein
VNLHLRSIFLGDHCAARVENLHKRLTKYASAVYAETNARFYSPTLDVMMFAPSLRQYDYMAVSKLVYAALDSGGPCPQFNTLGIYKMTEINAMRSLYQNMQVLAKANLLHHFQNTPNQFILEQISQYLSSPTALLNLKYYLVHAKSGAVRDVQWAGLTSFTQPVRSALTLVCGHDFGGNQIRASAFCQELAHELGVGTQWLNSALWVIGQRMAGNEEWYDE